MRRRHSVDPYPVITKHIHFTSLRDVLPIENRRATRDTLPLIYNDLGFKRGAEIGIFKGEYALITCQQIPQLEYFCIDPYRSGGSVSQEQMQTYRNLAAERLKLYNAKIIQKTSMEALNDFADRSLDFIYIDGDHSFDAVILDIVFWSSKVKRGGIVACHDYCNGYLSGVIKAVDAYTYCHKINPWFVIGELPKRIEIVAPTAFWVNP